MATPSKIYEYQPPSGKLPGISFEEQTEDFLNDLSGRVDEASGAADIAQEALEKAEEALDKVNDLKDIVDAHGDQLADHEGRIEQLENQVEDHEGRIGELEVTAERHGERLDELEARVDNHDAALDDLSERLNDGLAGKLDTDLSNIDPAAVLPVENGGTGADNADDARENLGLTDDRLVPEGGTVGQVLGRTGSAAGVGWVDQTGGGGGGGIPEAPQDGKQYGRKDGSWSEILRMELSQNVEENDATKAASSAVAYQLFVLANGADAKAQEALDLAQTSSVKVLSAPTAKTASEIVYAGAQTAFTLAKGPYQICPVMTMDIRIYRSETLAGAQTLVQSATVDYNDSSAQIIYRYLLADTTWAIGDYLHVQARAKDDLGNYSDYSAKYSRILQERLGWSDTLVILDGSTSHVSYDDGVTFRPLSGMTVGYGGGVMNFHKVGSVVASFTTLSGSSQATGTTDQANKIILSSDGVTSTSLSVILPQHPSGDVGAGQLVRYRKTAWCVGALSDKFIAVSNFGDICFSPDGEVWTLQSTPMDMTPVGKSRNLDDAAYSCDYGTSGVTGTWGEHHKMVHTPDGGLLFICASASASISGLPAADAGKVYCAKTLDGVTWTPLTRLTARTTSTLQIYNPVMFGNAVLAALDYSNSYSGGYLSLDAGSTFPLDVSDLNIPAPTLPEKTGAYNMNRFYRWDNKCLHPTGGRKFPAIEETLDSQYILMEAWILEDNGTLQPKITPIFFRFHVTWDATEITFQTCAEDVYGGLTAIVRARLVGNPATVPAQGSPQPVYFPKPPSFTSGMIIDAVPSQAIINNNHTGPAAFYVPAG